MNETQGDANNSFIPQIEPWIDQAELDKLAEVIKSTFVTEHSKTEEFERLFEGFTGTKHAVAYSNGTMAIFAALHVLGIGEGDEVIVPDLTFIATANAVILTGAKPVFCDIDPKTLQMTAELAEPKITDKTKAIIPVHLYGGAVQMEGILQLAKRHNLKVIEDAAQGVGVRLDGKHVGTFGEIGVLSFYGNKTMTTGEGGLILTDSEELAKECFAFKNHGRDAKGIFTHDRIGYNFSMCDLNAAIGIAQFKKLPTIIERKKQIFERYRTLLPHLEFYEYESNVDAVPWFTSIRVDDPDQLAKNLKERNIGTRRFFYPLHLQPCYEGMDFTEGEFPGTMDAYEHGLSLPSSITLTDEQIHYVIKNLEKETSIHGDSSSGIDNPDCNPGYA